MLPERMIMKEESYKGDVAKSLEGVIETHFISKRFKDIMGATRLTRYEILSFALMEILRMVMKINSLSYVDMDEKNLKLLPKEEQAEIMELWSLKKRFMRNPHALGYVMLNSFEYMYGLGLQSLDGLSRQEGITLANEIKQNLLDPDKMGSWEKMKRRLLGDVSYTN